MVRKSFLLKDALLGMTLHFGTLNIWNITEEYKERLNYKAVFLKGHIAITLSQDDNPVASIDLISSVLSLFKALLGSPSVSL